MNTNAKILAKNFSLLKTSARIFQTMKKVESDFLSKGAKCSGWLYLPEDISHPAVVIMAHGMGAIKEFVLPDFAERFCERGLAVFLFDYRHFNRSEGEPRQLISPKKQIEDWLNAIEHIRKNELVDGKRIALWGTSFSGGHMLVVGAMASGIKAIVAQVPFVGLAKTEQITIGYLAKAIFHGLWDALAGLFGSAHYVPLVGNPDEMAVLNTPECMEGYMALVPEDTKDWSNACPARIFLTLPFYRPSRYASKIKAPVLIVFAKKDSLIPYKAVERTASKIKNCRKILLDTGHFDVYMGEVFEQVVEEEARFLLEHLKS